MEDGTVQIWEYGTSLFQKTFRGHERSVETLDFSDDNKFIISSSSDKTVEKYLKSHRQPFGRKNIFTGATKGLDEALDDAAAFMLRNTYPTYSKVPPVIQGLRNIPFLGEELNE